MKTPDVFFILLIFLIFFFTLAWLEVLRPQCLALKWRNASKQWPKVKGKITIADLEKGFNRDGFSTDIWYEYTVNTIDYASHRIALGVFLETFREDAMKTLKQYKPGQAIEVYYNPANPKMAVLQPGVPAVRMRFGIMLSVIVIAVEIGLVATLIALANSAARIL